PPDVNMPVNRFLVFVLPLAFVLINVLLNKWLDRDIRQAARRMKLTIVTLGLLLVLNGIVLSSRAGENWRRVLLLDRPLFTESHALVLSNLAKLEELVRPGAEVVTYWAGIPAYFSRYRLIDGMGYSDPHIARRPLPEGLRWSDYTPGHMKRDATYLLAQRPDAFFQFWDLENLPVRWPRHHMRWSGYLQVGEFWLRRDSPYVRWELLPATARHSPR
ncbi:MAG TPA: hypothetical protein VHM02_07295, partial [Thermoanaerobaculia bacterium]|nr:hypothetical protein [Thermoanaerobaculia bacterium]